MPKRILQYLKRYEDTLILVVGLFLAVWLRYTLRDFESGDFRAFTSHWYDFIVQHGGFNALRYDFANYTPPYLYLLTLATYLFSGVSQVFAIKLVSILFDLICAFFVYRLVRVKYPSGVQPSFAALVFLFAPTVFLNSSLWGQADVIYTSGLVACLYFLAVRRPVPALLAFGLALAFKLQAIFLVPLLLILFLQGRISWWHFLLIPLVYLITVIPAWLLGRPLPDLLLIYLNQTDYYHNLTKNAPNLYQWFPDRIYNLLYPTGLVWTGAVIFFLVASVYKSRTPLTPTLMVEVATISVLATPYFLPKMHERYFFAADVCSLVFAFYCPRSFWLALLIQLVSFFAYLPFLFDLTIIPLPYLALVLLGVLVMLARYLALTLQPEA